jgi:zinc-finger-containing domain
MIAVPICPYCQRPAVLIDSKQIYGRSYGKCWKCPNDACDAYVGIHEGSRDYAPLGRLANAELRAWKIRAHAAFDPLWKDGGPLKRAEAYKVLQMRLGIPAAEAHVGMMDVEQCRAVVEAFTANDDVYESYKARARFINQPSSVFSGLVDRSPNPQGKSVDRSRKLQGHKGSAAPRDNMPGGDWPHHPAAPTDLMEDAITGANYRPLTGGCECDVPPWEVCPECAYQREWSAFMALDRKRQAPL